MLYSRTLFICSVCKSLHLLAPASHSILPPTLPLSNRKSVLYVWMEILVLVMGEDSDSLWWKLRLSLPTYSLEVRRTKGRPCGETFHVNSLGLMLVWFWEPPHLVSLDPVSLAHGTWAQAPQPGSGSRSAPQQTQSSAGLIRVRTSETDSWLSQQCFQKHRYMKGHEISLNHEHYFDRKFI